MYSFGMTSWSSSGPAPESDPGQTAETEPGKPSDAAHLRLVTEQDDPGSGPKARRKPPAPAGKVKASFNMLRDDLDSLRSMANLLGTTVTSVLQRAIRDERFIQEQLAEGNRFAVMDPRGTVREIIWR
jgi:hypothetical protein